MSSVELFKNPTVIWFVLGLILLISELFIPGFVIIFFGVGAWVTALFCLLFNIHFDLQLVIFTFSSVILLFVFRKYLKGQFFNGNKENVETLEDEFINKTAVVEKEIRKGYPGKVNFKGTTWTALAEENIGKGELVKIIGKESINLIVHSLK